ncbi:HNH endonuclease [Bradyrhizobium sp. 182]|uniref:HNH endonuclease n=1 Tax=Bradyrhizobium sp. 182 TaxID=2782651 RepID=UPI001FF790B2|nr:HNH endonuclease [Bradyrhizobium sp. 182]MCK1531158.1 HNH endonuclease [Bradyrhizobium sp. 182]
MSDDLGIRDVKLGRTSAKLKRKPFGFYDPTQERLQHLFSIDPETGEFTRLVTTGPKAKAGTKTFGTVRHGRHLIRVDGRTHFCSRLVHIYFNGAIPPGKQIDHELRDASSDRLSHLRLCTPQNNLRNRGKRHDNSSYFIGLSWHQPSQKYRAYCNDAYGIKRHLGYFKDPIEAARVRDAFALRHHGEFAELNFNVARIIEPMVARTAVYGPSTLKGN